MEKLNEMHLHLEAYETFTTPFIASSLGWGKSPFIFDPACGSGSFLNGAIEYNLSKVKKFHQILEELMKGEKSWYWFREKDILRNKDERERYMRPLLEEGYVNERRRGKVRHLYSITSEGKKLYWLLKSLLELDETSMDSRIA